MSDLKAEYLGRANGVNAWQIDRDYLDLGEDFPTRVGTGGPGVGVSDPETGEDYPLLRFRMRDDDGEAYYGGWVRDDPWGENQSQALSYGAYDAGASEIQVRANSTEDWRTDIG